MYYIIFAYKKIAELLTDWIYRSASYITRSSHQDILGLYKLKLVRPRTLGALNQIGFKSHTKFYQMFTKSMRRSYSSTCLRACDSSWALHIIGRAFLVYKTRWWKCNDAYTSPTNLNLFGSVSMCLKRILSKKKWWSGIGIITHLKFSTHFWNARKLNEKKYIAISSCH